MAGLCDVKIPKTFTFLFLIRRKPNFAQSGHPKTQTADCAMDESSMSLVGGLKLLPWDSVAAHVKLL